MHPLLSSYTRVLPVWRYPISLRKSRVQRISLRSSNAACTSLSVVLKATFLPILDPQEIKPLGLSPNHWHHPSVERLVSAQSPNDASDAAVSLNGFWLPLLYRSPTCFVVHRYFTSLFRAWQWTSFGRLRYRVSLLVAYAISGLVNPATYSTPPSTLGYDQFLDGGLSSSVVFRISTEQSIGVLVFRHSVSPQAWAIFVIASSWLS